MPGGGRRAAKCGSCARSPRATRASPFWSKAVWTGHRAAAVCLTWPWSCSTVTPSRPFRWDEDRRAQLRPELDAYFFHLYGISHDVTDYMLESFQSESGGLKNIEIAKFGEYRTKRLVHAEYDRMADVGLTLKNPLTEGESGSYRSTLTPPPGHGLRHPAASDN